MPDPREIATIVINGQEITDWETIWCHLEYPGRWRSFRFSVSEFDPNFSEQIMPAMSCDEHLAGEPKKGLVLEPIARCGVVSGTWRK